MTEAETKPSAEETQARTMLAEYGCADIRVEQRGEDTWLLAASVPGIAMIAHSDRNAETPRDPVYLAGQIIADMERIRAKARAMAPPRSALVTKIAKLLKEKAHAEPPQDADQDAHADGRGHGDGSGDPDSAVGSGAAPSGGDDGVDGGLGPEGLGAQTPTAERLEEVDATIMPSSPAPLDADASEVDDTPVEDVVYGHKPEAPAAHGGTLIDDTRERLAAEVDAEAKARIDACDEVLRNTPMQEINNARMMGVVTDEQAAQEARFYAAQSKRVAVAETASKLKRAAWEIPPDQLANFKPGEPSLWPT